MSEWQFPQLAGRVFFHEAEGADTADRSDLIADLWSFPEPANSGGAGTREGSDDTAASTICSNYVGSSLGMGTVET